MVNKKKCYIYTRVSTAMQVDGFSLDAQKNSILKYVNYRDMEVCGEYSDEGKSGKNTQGRPQFMQMMEDIQSGKDNVDYVVVFKLSRFGRNAADILSNLQLMQDYGVNLACSDDDIDSAKAGGKLMITILSAVSEVERENILVQTMEGRNQKAREGRWNGGFAPYGYDLVDGELVINEEDADLVRLIFDKYINTDMGALGVAKFLNDNGYKKKARQKNHLEGFSGDFIKDVLDNPVYCGKIAYGRRRTEKIPGTHNETHIVKKDEFDTYDGIHEAIISEEDWNRAHEKRLKDNYIREKVYSLDHEHALSGILKCPVCGGKMYGNVSRKKKPDGSHYTDYFFYRCRNGGSQTGHECTYSKQHSQDLINDAVAAVISNCTHGTKTFEMISKILDSSVDVDKITEDIAKLTKQKNQEEGAQRKIHEQMDTLDVTDKFYDKKYEDLVKRDNEFYNRLDEIEEEIGALQTRIDTIQNNKLNKESVFAILKHFDEIYPQMTYAEKKMFFQIFVERVDIYEDYAANGQILKSIVFKIPLLYDNKEATEISWDKMGHVETVVHLTRYLDS